MKQYLLGVDGGGDAGGLLGTAGEQHCCHKDKAQHERSPSVAIDHG